MPSLNPDLQNAGAEWLDQETVGGRGLVTSRSPDGLPAFNREMIVSSAGRGEGGADDVR